MANRNVRGPTKQLGKSCSKLKHRHPQNKKRICNLHPQNLERMSAKQEDEEQK